MTTKRLLSVVGVTSAVCGVLSARGVYPATTGTIAAVCVAVIGVLTDGSVSNV